MLCSAMEHSILSRVDPLSKPVTFQLELCTPQSEMHPLHLIRSHLPYKQASFSLRLEACLERGAVV